MVADKINDLNKIEVNGRYEMKPLLATSMDDFLNTISQLQDQIRTINDNLDQIQTTQAAMVQTADAQDLAKHRNHLDTLTQTTQSQMSKIKEQLKKIEPTSQQSDLTIRKNQFAALTKQFLDVIERYRTNALDFQRDEAKQLERQIRIANPQATADEIDQAIIQAEQGHTDVFTQQLLQKEQRQAAAQSTLAAVQERHEDIRRLAASVQELSTLFQEMQYLLENQDKVLGEIEVNSYDIVDKIEQGEKHVATAILSAQATRRKKWICFGIFITILIIIAIVLAIKFAPSSSK